MQPDITLPKTPAIKEYTALLSQTGTAAPTATILKNTTGTTITWTRTNTGLYKGTAATAIFPVAKTAVSITATTLNSFATGVNNEDEEPATEIIVSTYAGGTDTVPADDLLYLTQIKIEIYV